MVVVVLIFLKHIGLRGSFTDSNYFYKRNQYRAQKISRTRKRRLRARCVHGCNCARNLQRPEHHTSVPPSRSVNSVKFSMQPFSYKINKKNLNTKKWNQRNLHHDTKQVKYIHLWFLIEPRQIPLDNLFDS